jgi:hypothetical protein
MRVDRTQEVARCMGAQQFLCALDLFVEVPNGLRQQLGAGLRSLGV